MNPYRYNAHKNLGVALEGLGRYAEAAISYITASKLNPKDPRARKHLDVLVAAHPEVRRKIPGLKKQIDACRKAVVAWT
jgi:tetratricopeptide (TPR) repeat protein